ncbi:asparagine synthase (glutamine-hydrolyzing) [Gammaproteobacteria bacterium]|jgi:asparagine synthase (glutamine-hydrolysing)|nr:asparagine synthase (glutamine-hydrolyzing) [Gammaproteobacteria bacterium]
MCGVMGQWGKKTINKNEFVEQAKTMTHRGPDHFGSWFDDDNNVALGHLRLSILDLSATGNQPMESFSSRYVLSYNGEIYNFLSIKAQILKVNPLIAFNGSSDTEVLLAAIELFGFQEALKKCIGMFAIALWDKRDHLLYLARDRAGEKPLYYHLDSQFVTFSSEMKAIEAQDISFNISYKSINLFLAQGNIPAPHTIYKNVFKVNPGEILIFSSPTNFKSEFYWDLDAIKINNNLTQSEVNQNFESLFLDSVQSQMMADVPLGAFLSGGIDSSAVVSAMVEVSQKQVKTYSIGFNEQNYNEAATAKKISKHLGTDHHEFFLNEDDALKVIPNLQNIYCEPFADSSQIPTFLLCQETKKDVTVCLSGDGGDEIFGGYRRYIDMQRFKSLIDSTPYFLRVKISKFLQVYQGLNNKNYFDPLLKRLLNLSHPSEQLYKISNVLAQRDLRGIFYSLALQWHDGLNILQDEHYIDPAAELDNIFHSRFNDVDDVRRLDVKNYLPNDILVKVDRAGMANSLETRIPFLDINLVEFGLSIPLDFLIHGSQGKIPVREFLKKRIPTGIMNSPKTGFGVPIEHWLKGKLRPWAEDMLDESQGLERLGLDRETVLLSWHNFQFKGRPLHHGFWNILMLLSWRKAHPSAC